MNTRLKQEDSGIDIYKSGSIIPEGARPPIEDIDRAKKSSNKLGMMIEDWKRYKDGEEGQKFINSTANASG